MRTTLKQAVGGPFEGTTVRLGWKVPRMHQSPLTNVVAPCRATRFSSIEHAVSTWRLSTERQHGVAGNYTHYCVCFQQFHRTQ